MKKRFTRIQNGTGDKNDVTSGSIPSEHFLALSAHLPQMNPVVEARIQPT